MHVVRTVLRRVVQSEYNGRTVTLLNKQATVKDGIKMAAICVFGPYSRQKVADVLEVIAACIIRAISKPCEGQRPLFTATVSRPALRIMIPSYNVYLRDR